MSRLQILVPAVASFALGAFVGSLKPYSGFVFRRDPAAVVAAPDDDDDPLSRNDYARLPCADAAMMKVYMEKLKVRTPPQGSLCGEGSDYEKLGKLLRFMEESKFSEHRFPESGGFRAARAPFDDISSLVKSINFEGFGDNDPEEHVVAYNQGDDVFVGPMLLRLPPLDGASIFIHEAFHSDRTDIRHTRCAIGHFAAAEGACDAVYGVGTAPKGAYSISVQYYLAVAFGGVNFSRGDKDYAYAQTVALLDNRFNALPSDQAVIETILLLDDKGRLRRLHPILRTLMAPMPFAPGFAEGDLAERVLEPSGGFVCVRSRLGGIRCGAHGSAFGNPLRFVREGGKIAVKDYRRLTEDASANYVLDGNDRIATVQASEVDGGEFLRPSAYQPTGKLKALLSGDGFRRMVLSQAGELFAFGDSPRKFMQSALPSDPGARGWSEATGGFLSSTIFAIQAGSGDLYRWNRADRVFVPSDAQCASEDGALQYAEGALTRTLLCQDGSLVLGRYNNAGTEAWSPWIEPGSRFVGVGVVPHFLPGPGFAPTIEKRAAAFAKLCGVEKPIFDPWTDGYLGVDDQGQLVATGRDETTCRVSQHPKTEGKKLLSISLSGGKVDSNERDYAPYGMDLVFGDGSKLRIDPYY
jgi:hypothetical protein